MTQQEWAEVVKKAEEFAKLTQDRISEDYRGVFIDETGTMFAEFRDTYYEEQDDVTLVPFTFEDLKKDSTQILAEKKARIDAEKERLRIQQLERELERAAETEKRRLAAEKSERTTYERLKKKFG